LGGTVSKALANLAVKAGRKKKKAEKKKRRKRKKEVEAR